LLLLAGLCAGIQWPKSHSPTDAEEGDHHDLSCCFVPGTPALDRRPQLAAALARKAKAAVVVVVAKLNRLSGLLWPPGRRRVSDWGNPVNLTAAGARGGVTQQAAADAFAANILPVVCQIQAAGATTPRAIAAPQRTYWRCMTNTATEQTTAPHGLNWTDDPWTGLV
jgi:hypothetical protein